MAKFCGGFKYDTTSLKLIKGILCLADAQDVDPSKAITGCGQLWDGEAFKIVKVDGYRPCVTLVKNDNNVDFIAGNCGVGLDGTFFTKTNNTISVINGYVLTVALNPTNAMITVLDDSGVQIDPMATSEGFVKFCLPNIGAKYSVTVEADGFIGKSQTIDNNGNQDIEVELPIWKFDNFDVQEIPKSESANTGYYGKYIDIDSKASNIDQVLTLGNKYKVVFDGVTYIVECVDYLTPNKILGELKHSLVAYYETPEGGETIVNVKFDKFPFFITSIPATSNGIGQIYTKESGTHSIAIYEAK